MKMEDSHDQKILHTLLLGVLRLYFERISRNFSEKSDVLPSHFFRLSSSHPSQWSSVEAWRRIEQRLQASSISTRSNIRRRSGDRSDNIIISNTL